MRVRDQKIRVVWQMALAMLLVMPASAVTQRVATTTLAFPQAPVAPGAPTWRTAEAFPGLNFSVPVGIATIPGDATRLFVMEKPGRIAVITNFSAPSRSIFLDLSAITYADNEGGLLGLAFHPQYASNHLFYVYYTANAASPAGTGIHDRVSCFTTSPTNPNVALTTTEVILISQFDQAGNHNGGDLHFGPDGYLYISLGDEGGGNDTYTNSQVIDRDFFAGILRMDVDHRPGNLPPNPHLSATTNYAVPFDNPFVGATQFNGLAVDPANVRTEFYAVGLRNPFRFSFDPVLGTLYCGDVGQSTREEVNVIVKGGNYGWKWREGLIANPAMGTPPPGFSNAIDPILDYPRGTGNYQGTTVTGGIVTRSMQAPERVGDYIFADYGSGNIWALTYNGTTATNFMFLVKQTGIVAFGEDPRGGHYPMLVDINTSRIRLLLRDPAPGSNIPPPVLSSAGAFQNVRTLTPTSGVESYAVNWPAWADGAANTQRWFCVPDLQKTMTFSPTGNWGFPTGSVWLQHFELPTVLDGSTAVRRVETRVLIKTTNAAGGYGLSYRWGGELYNGFLVPTGGLNEAMLVSHGGTVTTQIWRYPSQSECLACHQPGPGFALGFNTPQLNRVVNNPSWFSNQIDALSHAGYFPTNVTAIHALPRLAQPDATEWSLEYRVRSYLQANCSQCHRPAGPTPANFDARATTPLADAGLIGGLLDDTLGDPSNVVVRPGDLPHSMLRTRLAETNFLRMPPLGSSIVDTQAVALFDAWITGPLTNYVPLAAWQERHFGSVTNPLADPQGDPDGDFGRNQLEYLTGTDPTNSEAPDGWAINIIWTNDSPAIAYGRIANLGFDAQWASNLAPGFLWFSLDDPRNAPFYSSENREEVVPMPTDSGETTRVFRVRVYAP